MPSKQTEPGMGYQFGPFQVHSVPGELLKNGRRVPLQELPHRLLVALLEKPGEVITREELRSHLWPDNTFVDFDSSLRVAVGKLREALDDDASDPRYVETVPKRGYRFLVSEVRRMERSAEATESALDLEPSAIVSPPMVAIRGRTPLSYSIAGVTAILLTLAAGFLWHQRTRLAPLTDKDTLVLADFRNATGDPVFDGTLRQGLAIQLAQSPFLKIMDDEQVQQTLRLMSLPPEAQVTRQVAQDICVREAAAATIEGSIVALGRSYVITLQAITCPGGVTLAREQAQADDKEHVLRALGSAATAMRIKLGESRDSIQKSNLPLDKATTSSLEALQNYTKGRAELTAGRFRAARPLLERAIALDSNFAMAYYYLATNAINEGDDQDGEAYKRKAFALIDRVSEYERYYIAGGYYESTGELDKAMDAYRLGIANYPRDWGFHNYIGLLYIDLGQFEAGLREGQAASRLQPDAEPPYRRQLDAYMQLNRLDEAEQAAENARLHGIDGARIHQRFLAMAYLKGDSAAVDREIGWYAGKPDESISFELQMIDRNLRGERRESNKFYKLAEEMAIRQGTRHLSTEWEEEEANRDAMSGNCGTARHLGRPALALALCGDSTGAERLAAETSKRFPNGTLWNAVQLPEIRAAIALQRGKAGQAVELLSLVSAYERAYPEAVYLRGLAYLHLGRGLEAAAEFQKILDYKGACWPMRYPNWGLYYPISHVGMAHASLIMGDKAKAKQSFQNLFTLWKDADVDLPILRQARKEYAKLQ